MHFKIDRYSEKEVNEDEINKNYLHGFKEELQERKERHSIDKDQDLCEWNDDEINKRKSVII